MYIVLELNCYSLFDVQTIQLSERRINMSVEEQLLLKDQLLRQYSEDLSTEVHATTWFNIENNICICTCI